MYCRKGVVVGVKSPARIGERMGESIAVLEGCLEGGEVVYGTFFAFFFSFLCLLLVVVVFGLR